VTAAPYHLHGLRLAVAATGEAERAAAGVRARLAGLPTSPGSAGPPDVTFEVLTGRDGHPFDRPAGARPVYDPPLGEVVYDDASDRLYIGHGPRLAVLCEPGRGRTRASLAGTGGMEEADLWTLSHPLFTLPLVEMLKRRGLYGLHAGGVCRDGRALLLPGTSGAGKTTLTLALARAGLGFLGDDTLFLRRGPEGLEVLAFPDELDLTDETVSFFSDLGSLLDTERPEGWRKRQLLPDGAGVVWQAAPALLVFPRVAGVPESRLVPMDRGEALLELAPNVLLTEPRSAQAHLDALAELVERSECWRLATGTDLEEAVRRVTELLAAEVRA
jgi:hypothetical protein